MKIDFNRLSIKKQLVLMVLIAVIIMIVTQLVFYFKFYNLTRERSKVFIYNLFQQIEEKMGSSLENINASAVTASYNINSQKYLITENSALRVELNGIVFDLLKYVVTSQKDINSITLIDNSNKKINYSTIDDNYFVEEMIKKYGLDFEKPIFTSAIFDTGNQNYYAFMTPIFSAFDTTNSKQRIGTCIIICKADYIQDVISKILVSQNSSFFITDSDSKVVASNKKDTIGSNFDLDSFNRSLQSNTGFQSNFNGNESIVQYNVIPQMEWKIISIVPIKELIKDMEPIRNFGVFVIVLMVAFLSLVGIILSKNIMKPIFNLIEFMKGIEDKNLKHRLETSQGNEVSQLAVYVNAMLDSLEKMTKRIVHTQSSLYEMELAKKQAQYLALQSQINPHFLYNTLECIRSIANSNKIKEIERISSSMSRIFRYSIKGEEFVKISDEIQCIKDYFSIIAIRYKDRFKLSVEVSEEVLNKQTIKMILQPIVENSIYHGLEMKRGPGNVMVKGYIEDEAKVVIEIIDDGIGINAKKLNEICSNLVSNSQGNMTKFNTNESMALANICDRIKLHYGEDFGIHIFSGEKTGTRVVFYLPAGNQ